MFQTIKTRFKNLKEIWTYGDGQPTEMTLAMINVFLTPLALCLELKQCGVFEVFLVISGLHQLWCVSKGLLSCRLRGAFFTFSAYFGTLIMYLGSDIDLTPTHWGWGVLVIASLSSLLRIKKEQLYRL